MMVDLTVRIRVRCDTYPDAENLSDVRDLLMEDYADSGVTEVEILDVSKVVN